LRGKYGKGGAMLTPQKTRFYFCRFYVGANFSKNGTRNATVRVRTDGQTDARAQTGFIICPMRYAIDMGQINISYWLSWNSAASRILWRGRAPKARGSRRRWRAWGVGTGCTLSPRGIWAGWWALPRTFLIFGSKLAVFCSKEFWIQVKRRHRPVPPEYDCLKNMLFYVVLPSTVNCS